MPKKKCPDCEGRCGCNTWDEESGIFLWKNCPTCHGAGYVFKKPTVKQMKKIAKLIKENK